MFDGRCFVRLDSRIKHVWRGHAYHACLAACISESLTRYKKGLFGEVNKLRKRIRWKHIWTQNSRIYIKEIDKSAVVVIDSYEDLDEFKSSHPPNIPPPQNQPCIGIVPFDRCLIKHVLTIWPLTSTSACLVTKQCLMMFGRQTFPVWTDLYIAN